MIDKRRYPDIDFYPESRYKIIGEVGGRFILEVGKEKDTGDIATVLVEEKTTKLNPDKNDVVALVSGLMKFCQDDTINFY